MDYLPYLFRAQQHDENAAEQLVKWLEKPLFRYIRSLVDNEDDSYDLLQETLLRIFNSIDRVKYPSKFKSWCFSIAYRKCMDYFRKRGNMETPVDPEIFRSETGSSETGIPEFGNDPEVREALFAGIRDLPLRERGVVALFYFNDFKYREIAEVFSIPINTVKTILFQARRRLKNSIVNSTKEPKDE